MSPDSRPTALVTGGARRIGRAICLDLAAAGVAVCVHHRTSAAEAGELVQEIVDAGGVACALAADLSEASGARALAAEASDRLGPVSLLVHNASSFVATPLDALAPDELDDGVRGLLGVHVAAPLALVHALAPGMRARGGGSVVFLGDACVRRPDHAPYLASKAALASLTRNLARDLAPAIRVNMVAPGSVLPAEHDGPAAVPRLVENVPAGRLGTVEEVAAAVRFLALGPQFVTGQVLGLDGGQYA